MIIAGLKKRKMELRKNRLPIYCQIAENLDEQIKTGVYKPGDFFLPEQQPTDSFVNHTYKYLSDIIQHGRIRTVFQPIISLKSAKVYGYEALSRIIGPSVFKGPKELFQAAIQYNQILVEKGSSLRLTLAQN